LLEELAQPNSGGVGGAGHHVWRFPAVAPGTGKIEWLPSCLGGFWKAVADLRDHDARPVM